MIRKGALLKTGMTAALTLAPVIALAHDWGFSQAGLYIGAGGGVARNRGLNNSNLPKPFTNFSGTQGAWKAFMGLAFDRFFAIQADYLNFGTDTISTPIGSEQVRNRGYDLNALLSFPFTSRLSLFIEGGASRFHTRTITPISTTVTRDQTHPDYGAGIQYYVTRHVAFRGEWQEFRIPNNNTQLYSGDLVLRF